MRSKELDERGLELSNTLHEGRGATDSEECEHSFFYQGSLYFPISISSLLKYELSLEKEILVSLGPEKIIKIRHSNSELKKALHQYKEKGLNKVYLEEIEFKKICEFIKESIPSSSTDFFEQVKSLDDAFALLQEGFQGLGVSSAPLYLAEDISKGCIELIESNPQFFDLLKKFRSRCSKEFITIAATVYTANLIISKLSWQSHEIKKKLAYGAFMCDISLTQKECTQVKNEGLPNEDLPSKLWSHSIHISEQIQKLDQDFPLESLEIIEQHHEEMDGSGFPRQLKASQISKLSIIHNLSSDFISSFLENHFDSSQAERILQKLCKKYDTQESISYIWILFDLLKIEKKRIP